MAADWKITGSAASSGLTITSLGNGLAQAFGVLTAAVTSGLTFDGGGNIIVKNGSGIAIDGSGHVTVNAGVGLTVSGGFLTVNPGAGLGISGSQIVIPGGAITNSLLAALSVATANIQSGAVTATQIASATITTANIANAAITTALIANAAITTALLGTAVVGTANIQNAAITTALIANLAVGNAQISDLAASKITAGTISAAISMTSPTIISVNGSVTMTLSSGQIYTIDSSNSHSSLLTQGALQISDGGSNSILLEYNRFTLNDISWLVDFNSSQFNFKGAPIQMNGTTVIDAALTYIQAPSFQVPGWTFINSSAQATFSALTVTTSSFNFNGTAVTLQTVGGVANVMVA